MKKTIITSLNFSNTSGGQAHVQILGPGISYSYDIINDDTRNFHLEPAIYSLLVHGTSGGTLNIAVTADGSTLKAGTCQPSHLFFAGYFTVT